MLKNLTFLTDHTQNLQKSCWALMWIGKHGTRHHWMWVSIVSLSAFLGLIACNPRKTDTVPSIPVSEGQIIELPPPAITGEMSLEEAFQSRRSIRQYSDQTLSLQEISQLLWAAQGVTSPQDYRTAPSAGALYPLEVYILTQVGVYRYYPLTHSLEMILEGDLRRKLYEAALEQDSILEAPVVFVIAAVYERTEVKYGEERTPRYVHLEAGHATQNLLLQAVSLGLGAVPIGAFHDAQVQAMLGIPSDHTPLYLIPVGHLP